MAKRGKETVTVTQDETKPVDAEVLATVIVRIDTNFHKAMSAGNEEAVVTLIRASSGVARDTIRRVLKSLGSLRSTYCTR